MIETMSTVSQHTAAAKKLHPFQTDDPRLVPIHDKVIVSACESTPYAISSNAKKHDKFWLKSQPYSLQDMLANDEAVDQFVGGTVYQAFLSALNYHRWHSPVSGTIAKAFVKAGTYYSEADIEGEDPAGPNNSQGYLTQVATRALFFIEADDPFGSGTRTTQLAQSPPASHSSNSSITEQARSALARRRPSGHSSTYYG